MDGSAELAGWLGDCKHSYPEDQSWDIQNRYELQYVNK